MPRDFCGDTEAGGTLEMEDTLVLHRDAMNGSDGNTAFAMNLTWDTKPVGKGQLKQKSAAQKKREKRIEKRKAAAVLSQISSTEKVSPIIGCQSVLTVEAAVEPAMEEGEESTALIFESMEIDVENVDAEDDLYSKFRQVFKRFECAAEEASPEVPSKSEIYLLDDEEEVFTPEETPTPTLSKKALRKLNRPSVGYLKQLVANPELVTSHETRATDPLFTLHLKGYRNFVPVPSHWVKPTDYLSHKRGIAKIPYQLPQYLLDTGITEVRTPTTSYPSTLRSQMRERVRPHMGTFDIDYQKLHDAFFRYQTKPPLSLAGQVYFEGKEHQTNFLHKRPGELSAELILALSIPPGAPPPWLVFMQKVGPPPAYPGLRIPGLNAPIPRGARWGFHPGGWGQPPRDEFGRPLYGDVFGVLESVTKVETLPVERELWGQIEVEVEEEVDDDDEESEAETDEDEIKMEEFDDVPGIDVEPTGLETQSGMASTVPIPESLELRKSRFDVRPPPESQPPGDLYKILPESQTTNKGFLGSTVYNFSQALDEDPAANNKGGVEISLDPSAMENVTKEGLKELHDHEMAKEAGAKRRYEDLSDMVAEHEAKQAKKRQTGEDKKKPKYKF